MCACLILAGLLVGCAGAHSGLDVDQPDRQADALKWAAFEKARDQCMAERGFPATVYPDGGRTFAGAGRLGEGELMSLLEECAEEAGGEPDPLPVTELEKGAMYDLEIKAYECLIAQGYEPDPPPTRERYVETFDTGPWFAHSNSGRATLPDDQCPKPKLQDIEW